MNNLRLIPDIRHRQSLVKVVFAFEQELNPLIKSQPSIRPGCAPKNKNDVSEPVLIDGSWAQYKTTLCQ